MLPTTTHKKITIFSHGLGARGEHGTYYHVASGQPNAFIEGPLHTFNYPDVNAPQSSCLGQEADMAALHQACKNYEQVNLVGVSRGAATIFNYLAHYNPKNIALVIAESPFDHVRSIVHHKTGFASFESTLPISFAQYDPKGPQPINGVEKIDRTIPILLVCSQEDSLIPVSSTRRLYEALRKTGHKKVHLLVTRYGKHANIINGKDGTLYRNVVHAFYKKYGKPYNAEWARAGQERFVLCQP